MNAIDMAETGLLPDALIRIGIRRLLAKRLAALASQDAADRHANIVRFAEDLRQSPLAIATEAANEQHYDVPAEFFAAVLGPRLKYSACYFATPHTSLTEAERVMLRLTCERADIRNGMRILELGCGWGSLTLWLAEHFAQCQITALSNSASQREFIECRARAQGFPNIRVITGDIREFATEQTFDRVVSVEMFEHMRNYELLLHRVSNWLTADGKAFVHVFCHRDVPYLFETEGAANWMGRHFFTGGMMPSEDLFCHFGDHLGIEQQWRVDGLHYARTCEAWLKNLDRHRQAILSRFRQDLSARDARTRLQRWRIFFMACAELFRYHDGKEWFVAHYLFKQKGAGPSPERSMPAQKVAADNPQRATT